MYHDTNMTVIKSHLSVIVWSGVEWSKTGRSWFWWWEFDITWQLYSRNDPLSVWQW